MEEVQQGTEKVEDGKNGIVVEGDKEAENVEDYKNAKSVDNRTKEENKEDAMSVEGNKDAKGVEGDKKVDTVSNDKNAKRVKWDKDAEIVEENIKGGEFIRGMRMLREKWRMTKTRMETRGRRVWSVIMARRMLKYTRVRSPYWLH